MCDRNFDRVVLPTPSEEEASVFLEQFRFQIPYNRETNFIAELRSWRRFIGSIYFPIPLEFMGTGRPWTDGDRKKYHDGLPSIIRAVSDAGFDSEILCNSILPDWSKAQALIKYLSRLHEHGLKHVTVAYLPLASLIHREIPSLEIVASTIAFIHDIARLERWCTEAGVKTIVSDRSLNKNIVELRKLRDAGVSIRLIVDENCMPSCPLQFQHYILFSLDNRISEIEGTLDLDTLNRHCHRYERIHHWKMFQSSPLPSNLPHYNGVVDTLKITRGRSKTSSHIINQMLYYMDFTNNRHFYLGYVEPEEVFDRVQECDRACRYCSWCKEAFYRYNEPTDAPEGRPVYMWQPVTDMESNIPK